MMASVKIKLIFVLGFCCLTSVVLCISISPNNYRLLIVPRCFNQTERHDPLVLGQHKPIGMSIDYFISLLQTIENNLSQLNSQEIIVLLLSRFHYDGFGFVANKNVQSFTEMIHRVVNEKLFEKVDQMTLPEFPEEILTEDEKCAMFYMMSHAVNVTKVHQDIYGNEQKTISREFGVVSLENGPTIGIALNSVLLGIAVGLLDVQSPSDGSIHKNQSTNSIDPLLAVTLSDKLAIAAMKDVRNEFNKAIIGTEGVWNSTYCQTEYRLLNPDGLAVTMAEINGGIDGWSIGRKLQHEEGKFLQKLKLSTLLKRYYSRYGLSPDCGICYLDYLSGYILDQIRETARNYIILWNEKYNNQIYEPEMLMGYVETTWMVFNQYLEKSKSIKSSECVRLSTLDIGNTQCETTSDIYLMIDNDKKYHYPEFQLNFITQLLIKLESLNYLGQIYLLVNAHRGFDSDVQHKTADRYSPNEAIQIPLHLLAYNTSSIQKATCRLSWYNYMESTIKNRKLLMKYLVQMFEHNNSTYNTFSKNRSKNFVWFSLNYYSSERLTERERIELYHYKWYLKYFHNVRIFFVSVQQKNTDDELYNIMLNQDDWFQVNADNAFDTTTLNKIAQRVCDTPNPINYEDCYNSTSDNVKYDSLISINKKQHWAVYPKYYLRSESVTLKFQAETRFRVCLDRWLYPHNKQSNCKESSSQSEMVEFEIKKPCQWKTLDSCLPIYFTISIADKSFLPIEKCSESQCKSFDQVGWSVSHTGLHCVNSISQLHQTSLQIQYLVGYLLIVHVMLFYIY